MILFLLTIITFRLISHLSKVLRVSYSDRSMSVDINRRNACLNVKRRTDLASKISMRTVFGTLLIYTAALPELVVYRIVVL